MPSLPKKQIKKYFTLVAQHKKGKPFQPIFSSYSHDECNMKDMDTFDDYYDSRILRSDDDIQSMERAVRDCNTSNGMKVEQTKNLKSAPGAIFTTCARRVVLVCSNGMVTKDKNFN